MVADLEDLDRCEPADQCRFNRAAGIAGKHGVETPILHVEHHRVLIRPELPLQPRGRWMKDPNHHGIQHQRVSSPGWTPGGSEGSDVGQVVEVEP